MGGRLSFTGERLYPSDMSERAHSFSEEKHKIPHKLIVTYFTLKPSNRSCCCVSSSGPMLGGRRVFLTVITHTPPFQSLVWLGWRNNINVRISGWKNVYYFYCMLKRYNITDARSGCFLFVKLTASVFMYTDHSCDPPDGDISGLFI